MHTTSHSRHTLATLIQIPGFGGLSLAALLLGSATSFAAPYMSLFGANKVGMSPLALGVFLTLTSLSSIVISTLVARWSDRLPSRRPIVLAAFGAAAIGYTLLAFTRNYWLLLLIGVVFLGGGASAFPQLFALTKARAGAAGEQGVATLRSVFSLAWVLGPGIGAAVLAWASFRGLFLVTATCFALATLPLLRLGKTAKGASAPPAEGFGALAAPVTPARPVRLIALSFVLYGAAMQMGGVALPLHVTRALHGSEGNVGVLLGLCALLEIPMMLGFALRPRRAGNEKLILWGLAAAALYFVCVWAAPNVWWVGAAQLIRAYVIAILATLGMAYVQELMPNRVGVATTLYANTMNAGALLGGLGVGLCAQAFGYTAVFALAAVLAALAWALLLATRRGLLTQPGNRT